MDHPNVCVDVVSLADAAIHREMGDCVHLVGYGYRLHRTRCPELVGRLSAERGAEMDRSRDEWRAAGSVIGEA